MSAFVANSKQYIMKMMLFRHTPKQFDSDKLDMRLWPAWEEQASPNPTNTSPAGLRGSSLHVKLSITLLPCAQNVADANTNGTQNSAHSTPMCADETRTDQERSQPAGNNSLTFFVWSAMVIALCSEEFWMMEMQRCLLRFAYCCRHAEEISYWKCDHSWTPIWIISMESQENSYWFLFHEYKAEILCKRRQR